MVRWEPPLPNAQQPELEEDKFDAQRTSAIDFLGLDPETEVTDRRNRDRVRIARKLLFAPSPNVR